MLKKTMMYTRPFFTIVCLIVITSLYAFISCKNPAAKNKQAEKKEAATVSPAGYALDNPQKFNMPDDLHEISGIAFNKGNSDTIYAEQDEEGKLYFFPLGSKDIAETKFGKHGDFEDVAINKGQVIMLRSDGVLFSFALSEKGNKKIEDTKEWSGLLPPGEYEGLAAGLDGNLIAMCKSCAGDDEEKEVSAHVIQQDANNSLSVIKTFKIEVGSVHLTSEKKHIKFHPSCLAQHPLTREWYVISSVNKELIIYNEQWQVKASYTLDPVLFKQPEGLAFDTKGNMYISNEGGDFGSGNILQFNYRP